MSDAYVELVLANHAYKTHPLLSSIRNYIEADLKQWAGNNLRHISLVGSVAKGTAIAGTADLDLFISLSAATPHTLKEIYEKLFARANANSWAAREQNVSVGINFLTMQMDLVPAKLQGGQAHHHSVWMRKKATWRQTAPELHVAKVLLSGRTKEIRAIKIWRKNHNLDFPSFYLELAVIKALAGRPNTLASNVQYALGWIAENLVTSVVQDPENTANDVSDELTVLEKYKIAVQAKASYKEPSWGKTIW